MTEQQKLEAERELFIQAYEVEYPDRSGHARLAFNGDAGRMWLAARRVPAAPIDAEGLPPMPDHPEPRVMQWSNLEKEAIRQAQRDAKSLGYALGRGAAVREYVEGREAVSVMLWLYRRLPRFYGRPPHVEAPITALAKVAGVDLKDVSESFAERAAAPSPNSPKEGAK